MYLQSLDVPPKTSPSHPEGDNTGKEGDSFHSNQTLTTDELSGKLDEISLDTRRTQECKDLLESMTSLTSKEDLVRNLRWVQTKLYRWFCRPFHWFLKTFISWLCFGDNAKNPERISPDRNIIPNRNR